MYSGVAPYAGAWIEIRLRQCNHMLEPSSLPTRERGLKCSSYRVLRSPVKVAPYAGAWIEITVLMICNAFRRRRSLRGSVD